MNKLKHKDWRVIDNAFDMHGGYVLDFSNRTMSEWFEDEFDIDIDHSKYCVDGDSKARRLRAFIRIEEGHLAAKVLRELWSYRNSLPSYSAEDSTPLWGQLIEVISKLEEGDSKPRSDALTRFNRSDTTLEELITAIERDLSTNKPEVTFDRLHTYCMKKFAHLLELHQASCSKEEPLHSRMGKYIKIIEEKKKLSEISIRILKSSISIFERYNHIRNDHSFAHDGTLLSPAEARFIFDSISAILRFIKFLEPDNFGK